MTNQNNAVQQNSTVNLANLDKLADQYLKQGAYAGSVPLDIARLPQFMQDYLKIAGCYTDAIPGALITALLPVIAANIGNRVFLRSKGKSQFCQIWAIVMGPSSISRKSTCIRLATRTLLPYENSLNKLSQEERVKKTLVISNATNAKTISLLALNSVRLFEFHEFGLLLKSAKHSYNAGIKENLTTLYDGDSKNIYNMERTERIINPAVSILGASTEGWIYSDFQNTAEQNSGFLQRFIYCIIKPDGKTICSDPDEEEPDLGPLEAYDKIFEIFRSIPGKFHLKMSREVRSNWLKEHDKVLNYTIKLEDEDLIAYATRIYTNVFCSLVIMITLMKHYEVLRLAIVGSDAVPSEPSVVASASDTTNGLRLETMQRLAALTPAPNLACKQFFENLEVSAETVEEALYLCHYYLENAKPMLSIITEGGAWHNERRIIKYLARQPEQKASHSSVMNGLRIKSRDLNECMRNLMEQNAVSIMLVSPENSQRATKIYHLQAAANTIYQ